MLRDRERRSSCWGIAAAVILLLSSWSSRSGRSDPFPAILPGRERPAELRKMRPELEQTDREVRHIAGRVTGAANAAEFPVRLTASLREAGFRNRRSASSPAA